MRTLAERRRQHYEYQLERLIACRASAPPSFYG
jgi:hypothetical protein